MQQLTENVKFLQKCVIYHQGKLLILKRAADAKTRPSCWDLPGGNVEWPETKKNLQDAHLAEITREVKEETGISLEVNGLISCSVGSYFDAEKQVYSLILGWMTDLETQPEIKLSDEHTDSVWIPVNQFYRYDFGFAGEKDGFIRKMVENGFLQLAGFHRCGQHCSC